MRRLMLAATMLAGLALPAQAATFTQSEAFGTGNFGTATATCLNVACSTVDIDINMDPNFLIDTGSHFLFTTTLLGTGRIDPTTVTFGAGVFPFTVGTHLTAPLSSQNGYSNSPFKYFTDAIAADCGPGGSATCGSTVSFNITDFQGFGFATETFNGLSILAAVDILLADGSGTGAVGIAGVLTPTPFEVSNVPIPGALPLFVSGLGGLWWLSRQRKKKQQQPDENQAAAA
jgi:hypothetical protein